MSLSFSPPPLHLTCSPLPTCLLELLFTSTSSPPPLHLLLCTSTSSPLPTCSLDSSSPTYTEHHVPLEEFTLLDLKWPGSARRRARRLAPRPSRPRGVGPQGCERAALRPRGCVPRAGRGRGARGRLCARAARRVRRQARRPGRRRVVPSWRSCSHGVRGWRVEGAEGHLPRG